jgi:hypothetical protein
VRVIYQYFSDHGGEVARRLDFPILLSMATLRAHHPECEIIVLEYNQGNHDWQDYPRRLGFEVVHKSHDPASHDGLLPIPLARPAHVWEHARGLTTYCDSDVMWLDRLPDLDRDYVHMNRSNTGLFLFDPACYRAAAFMGLWAHACAHAVRDQGLRDAMRAGEAEPQLHDESVYRHLRDVYPELLGSWIWILPHDEFAHPWDLPRARAGRLHLVMWRCGVHRGALAWLLRETQPALERCFTPCELEEILGPYYEMGGAFSLQSLDAAILRVTENAFLPLHQAALDR